MHPAIVNTQIDQANTTDSSHTAEWHQQSCEMLQQHYIDSAALWQAHADRQAYEVLQATGQEREYFHEELGVQGWGFGDYELEVFTYNTAECYSFAIFDADEAMFAPPFDRTIVHLSLPFPNPDVPVAECSLNDNIYWINGNQVVAAGIIDRVLYDDIIVTAEGLLVPVVVMPFACRFKAFTMTDAIDEDHQDVFLRYDADQETMHTKLKGIQPASRQDHAKIPRIAVEIDRILGLLLLIYIDDRSREAEARDDAGN